MADSGFLIRVCGKIRQVRRIKIQRGGVDLEKRRVRWCWNRSSMSASGEVLTSDDIYWTFKARELMQQKRSFVVVNWSKDFDEVESISLRRQFGYSIEYRNNDATRAFFSPSVS